MTDFPNFILAAVPFAPLFGAAQGLRSIPAERIIVALVITLAFAAVARRLRFVTITGAIAGFVLATTMFVCLGAGGFTALGMVFVLTFVATRIGYARKHALGMAERREGRGAMQVLANLSVAALMAVAVVVFGRAWLGLCFAAALAESAADTVSSECGKAWSNRVYLVTDFRRVMPGTNGGVSIEGTIAGIIAAAAVVGTCLAARLIDARGALLAGGVAVIATFIDSLLGATLERRHLLDNNGVNFFSTMAAALLTAALFLV